MEDNKYTVFILTVPNDKVYIGYINLGNDFVNGRTIEEVFNGGEYFIKNKNFYNDIKVYGWDNVKTQLITGLTKEQATSKKKELCIEYESYKIWKGYNKHRDAGITLSQGRMRECDIKQNTKPVCETGTYTVYAHIVPNGKYYIGQTSKKPKERWGIKGNGYYHKKDFYEDIQKYGWDNIKHVIICSNISKNQADYIQIYLIHRYNTTNPKWGYNKHNGGSVWSGYNTKIKISNYVIDEFLNGDKSILNTMMYLLFKYTRKELEEIYNFLVDNTKYIHECTQNKEFKNNAKKAFYIFGIIDNKYYRF